MSEPTPTTNAEWKATLSGGKCHFVMVKSKEWEVIDAEVRKASA